MGNSYKSATGVWEVDETGSLSNFSRVCIRKIVYVPNAAGDDLVFQDSNSNNAIVLKAGASDASPVHISYEPRGLWLNGIQCSTIDGGKAYVYIY